MTITEVPSVAAIVTIVLDAHGRALTVAAVPADARIATILALDELAERLSAAVHDSGMRRGREMDA